MITPGAAQDPAHASAQLTNAWVAWQAAQAADSEDDRDRTWRNFLALVARDSSLKAAKHAS